MLICLAGKNNIAVDGLRILMQHVPAAHIKVICNANDDGIDTWQKSLRKAAVLHNIDIISLEDSYRLSPTLFISLEFDKIIKPHRFRGTRLYNIHFSKLPEYKGMYTSALPILHGKSETGVTLHKIDDGIDTGDIIDQTIIPIAEADTARDIYLKYLLSAEILFNKNITSILENSYQARKQSAKFSTYFSKSSIDYENVTIDLRASASQIINQVRAFTFPEYQVPKVFGYFVIGGNSIGVKSTKKPGQLLSANEKAIFVSSIDYDVMLSRDAFSDLLHASRAGCAHDASKSIARGAAVNKRNGRGWTPLIIACFNGRTSVVEALLSNGALVDMTNYRGTTPLMYAMSYYERTGDKTVFELLLRYNAKLDLVDSRGLSISDYATARNVEGLI